MGLYLTYTKNIYKRRVKAVFFFRDGSVFLIKSKTTKEALPNLDDHNTDSYKQLFDYASNNNIDGFEILLDNSLGNSELNNIIGYISDYLLDKELSIGLLTKEQRFIEKNRKLLDNYGVTLADSIFRYECATPKRSPSRHPDECMFQALFISDKKADTHFRAKRKPAPRTIKLNKSFHESLMDLIRESDMDNADIYNRGGITRQVFSKIICTPTLIPKKETVICLCIGLELPLFEAQALLKTAGYILSESIMLDSIVMKYLDDEIYDLMMINSELNEFNCPLLGWHPRDN